MDDLIPAIPGEPRPDGYMGLTDKFGTRWWMNTRALTRQPPTAVLTDSQISRIRAFKDVLREHDHTTDEEAIANFRRDAHPEPEIRLMERIARVYQDELQDRPPTDQRERRLLFKALLECSFGLPDVEALVSCDRELEDLPNLQRVVTRFHQD